MQGPKLQAPYIENLDKEEKAALFKEEIPSLYPPFPQGTKVGTQDLPDAAALELIDKSRYFADFFRYSGYYQPAKQNDAVLHLERYSDRFRRVEGRRRLYEEIVEPSPRIFPEELLSGLIAQQETGPRRKAHKGFHSSQSLAKSRETILTIVDERVANNALSQPQGPDPEGEEEPPEDDDEEEEPEVEEEELSEADDYTELYGDDDEGGGEVFGDDDEDVF